MGKSKRDPWSELAGIKQRVDQLMEEAWQRFDLQERVRQRPDVWQPICDVFETDDYYVIQMELAGLSKEEVNLEIHQGELIISGERRAESGVSASSYEVLERFYGPFARSFWLPPGIGSEQIRAAMENGLLIVHVFKSGSPTRRRIEVFEE